MQAVLALVDSEVSLVGIVAVGVGLCVGIAINLLILMLSARVVTRIQLEFGESAKMSALVVVVNFAVGFVIGIVAKLVGEGDRAILLVGIGVAWVIGLLVAAAVYGRWVKDPYIYPESKARIGFGKGILVALMSYVILGVIGAVVVVGLVQAGVRVPGVQ